MIEKTNIVNKLRSFDKSQYDMDFTFTLEELKQLIYYLSRKESLIPLHDRVKEIKEAIECSNLESGIVKLSFYETLEILNEMESILTNGY